MFLPKNRLIVQNIIQLNSWEKKVPLRVGVIGVGYLGRHHARIYSGLDGVELVGVADINSRASEEIATAYNCRSFSDYAEIIAVCDALSIVTPTTTHHDIAMDCLRAGRDILIEKPIAESIEDAMAVVREADRKKLVLQVGHLERYNPGIEAASHFIREPHFIEAVRLSPFLGRATDVDVTIDLMIHDIDIVMGLMGSKPEEIRATGESLITDKIDVATAWLEFGKGRKALITASRIAPEKKRILRAYQEGSYIEADYQNQDVRRYYKEEQGISCEIVKPENREPLKEELKDFIHCVKNRKRPKVSGAEAMDALEIVLRITDMVKTEAAES